MADTWPRAAAPLAVVVAFLLVLGGLGAWLGPMVGGQLGALATSLTRGLQEVEQWLINERNENADYRGDSAMAAQPACRRCEQAGEDEGEEARQHSACWPGTPPPRPPRRSGSDRGRSRRHGGACRFAGSLRWAPTRRSTRPGALRESSWPGLGRSPSMLPLVGDRSDSLGASPLSPDFAYPRGRCG